MNEIETITQLFAAIYITLAVDIQFFQRFWSQTYYHTVTKIIDKYNFSNSTRLQKELMSDIRHQAVKWEKSSRKRGILMFCFCFIVLVYASFELPIDKDETHGYIRMIPFSFFTFVVALFSHRLLKSWWITFITGVFLLCILLFPYQKCFVNTCSPIIMKYCDVGLAKGFIICTLVFPILWQLFSNWLYSTIYTKYLVRLLNKESDDYKATIIAKRERNKTKLPTSYTSVMASLHISGETEINNVLNERLKIACKYPKFCTLLRYIHQKDENIRPINEKLKVRLNYNEHVNNSQVIIKTCDTNQSSQKKNQIGSKKNQNMMMRKQYKYMKKKINEKKEGENK